MGNWFFCLKAIIDLYFICQKNIKNVHVNFNYLCPSIDFRGHGLFACFVASCTCVPPCGSLSPCLLPLPLCQWLFVPKPMPKTERARRERARRELRERTQSRCAEILAVHPCKLSLFFTHIGFSISFIHSINS